LVGRAGDLLDVHVRRRSRELPTEIAQDRDACLGVGRSGPLIGLTKSRRVKPSVTPR
jgi:hypothetical protein